MRGEGGISWLPRAFNPFQENAWVSLLSLSLNRRARVRTPGLPLPWAQPLPLSLLLSLSTLGQPGRWRLTHFSSWSPRSRYPPRHSALSPPLTPVTTPHWSDWLLSRPLTGQSRSQEGQLAHTQPPPPGEAAALADWMGAGGGAEQS